MSYGIIRSILGREIWARASSNLIINALELSWV